MKTLLILLLALFTAQVQAAPPRRGKLVVKMDCNIYEGNSSHSKVAGLASKGQELDLIKEMPQDGHYKILYKGKVRFVMVSQVTANDDDLREIQGRDRDDDNNKKRGPSRGKAKVKASGCKVYEGSSSVAKAHGTCNKDEELEFIDKKPHNGFYKVNYRGKIGYVKASDCDVHDDDKKELEEEEENEQDMATAVPTKAATKAPTPRPTLRPTEAEEEPTQIPTRAPTARPTPEEEATPLPSHREPTPKPVEEEPTAVPDRREPTPKPAEEEPTAVPVRREPTPKPAEEEPTAVPVHREPTPKPAEPTEVPTQAPTPRPEEPTAIPTKVPTVAPYEVQPTPAPKIEPTAVPTKYSWQPTPMPKATAVLPRLGRGRRVGGFPQPTPRPVYRQRQQHSQQSYNSGYSAGSTVNLGFASSSSAAGDAWAMPGFSVGLAGGAGLCWTCMPAFKPEVTSKDERCIDSNGFFGLGAEWRVFSFWRLGIDWTGYTHRTKAADMGKLGLGVPAGLIPDTIFPDSDVQYIMDTNALRLGMKFSVPLPYVEPWVGGHVGKYFWSAKYMDSAKTIDYGNDSGVAFGMDCAAGVDIKLGGKPKWIITPFFEYGGPIVFPTVKNIGETGYDWQDPMGTPAVIPTRFGLALGIGF